MKVGQKVAFNGRDYVGYEEQDAFRGVSGVVTSLDPDQCDEEIECWVKLTISEEQVAEIINWNYVQYHSSRDKVQPKDVEEAYIASAYFTEEELTKHGLKTTDLIAPAWFSQLKPFD